MKNQAGFTLLSLMMALSVFSVTVLLLTMIPTVIAKDWENGLSTKKEVYTFFEQISSEIRRADKLSCVANEFLIYTDGSVVSFKKSGQRLYRQVDYEGVDIVLLDIDTIQFTCKNQAVIITIEDSGHHKEKWLEMSNVSVAGP